MARVLIAGCGYVGAALAKSLLLDAHDVWGLRRHTASLPMGVRPVAADLAVAGSLAELPPYLDFVVYMASPGGSDDLLYRTAYAVGLRNLLEALEAQAQHPRRVLFVSSTSVYAQQDGEWVDESSPTQPVHFSGRRVLEAEGALREAAFPGTVLRLGGIYGPGRTRLVERVREGRAVFRKPPVYTNRIHRDDAAGALRHLMQLASPESLYLGVDCEPADERTVQSWLAGVLGAPPPRPAASDRDGRPRSNKRCRNDRLRGSGYRFRYPSFREGYRAVLEGLD